MGSDRFSLSKIGSEVFLYLKHDLFFSSPPEKNSQTDKDRLENRIDFKKIASLNPSNKNRLNSYVLELFKDRFHPTFDSLCRRKNDSSTPEILASAPFLLLGESFQFTPIVETHFDELVKVLELFDEAMTEILTRFGHTDLGVHLRILLMEIDDLRLEQIPKGYSYLLDDVLFRSELWRFKSEFHFLSSELHSSSFFSDGYHANKLLTQTKTLIDHLRKIREIIEWINRELETTGKLPQIFQESSTIRVDYVLEKAKEANQSFRVLEAARVNLENPTPPPLAETAISAEELANAIKGEIGKPNWRFQMPNGIPKTPTIEELFTRRSLKMDGRTAEIIRKFSEVIQEEGELKQEGSVRAGFWAVKTPNFVAADIRREFLYDAQGLEEPEIFAINQYLRKLTLSNRVKFLESFNKSGLEILNYLRETAPFNFPTSANLVKENIAQSFIPPAEEGIVLFDESFLSAVEMTHPLHSEGAFNIAADGDPAIEILTNQHPLLDSKPFKEILSKGELLTQSSRVSFWTYFGIGGNIVGAILGPFATLGSFSLTVWDAFFNSKVSWLEVAVDAGITAVTGATTFYAIGGALYTGVWYFLTGTLAFAGAPWPIGVALLISGISLAYSKEGLREDRDAREMYETFIKSASIEKKARGLAALIHKKDEDEVVNKSLEELKRKNKEFLNPNNPEAQALWRSSIQGENREKPFGEAMRDAIRHWSSFVGSEDDAVSLMVIAQMMGNREDLIYALKKVDPESYEKFRYGIPGLKSFEELMENGLAPVVQPGSTPILENKINSNESVCEAEISCSEIEKEV